MKTLFSLVLTLGMAVSAFAAQDLQTTHMSGGTNNLACAADGATNSYSLVISADDYSGGLYLYGQFKVVGVGEQATAPAFLDFYEYDGTYVNTNNVHTLCLQVAATNTVQQGSTNWDLGAMPKLFLAKIRYPATNVYGTNILLRTTRKVPYYRQRY